MPIVSGGGGTSLPPQWTVSPSGDLLINVTDNSVVPLTVEGGGTAAHGGDVQEWKNADGDRFAYVQSDGYWSLRTFVDGQTVLEITRTSGGAAGADQFKVSNVWGARNDGAEFFGAIGTAPLDASVQNSRRLHWFDDSTGSPKLRFKQRDSVGTLFVGYAESASPITSGALPTQALVSGTGAQILMARAVETVTPFTGDGTNNAATCAIALSPDNVTYSTLATISIAAALNLTGVLTDTVNARVPAGWYLKLTAVHGAIGTTTYY